MGKRAEGERHIVPFGGHRIEFLLVWRERRHLAIEVSPDRTVTVVAPVGRDLEDILARVARRGAWIIKQLDYFERFQPLPPPRSYVAGETHLYLGRQYRLKVTKSAGDEVKLLGRYIHVFSSQPDSSEHTRRLVEDWYRVHAVAAFGRRLALCVQRARALKVVEPKLIVRRIKTRWGSCSRLGTILLNTELVKAPVDCIDYVITHELCHLRIHEHTPAFYRLLSRCMPDWERRKERLERVALPGPSPDART